MARNDDETWRAIVDNYGDRADLDADQVPVEDDVEPEPSAPTVQPPVRSWDDEFIDSDWSTDRFVPPPPPPLPTTTTDRLAAWLGVFGSPLVLLACLVLNINLPQPLPYLLVASFVGGFLYLVLTMSREPRDPGDNGAVI